MALRQRLLRDIAELERKPYPNIQLLPYEEDITSACLILTPNDATSLHLTVNFGDNYPLQPPTVTIQTPIPHPNVYGSFICASILRTEESYTSAYDLKGICIQLLSFFGSDSLEQEHGTGAKIDLREFQRNYRHNAERHACGHCSFDNKSSINRSSSYALPLAAFVTRDDSLHGSSASSTSQGEMPFHDTVNSPTTSLPAKAVSVPRVTISDLPDELLVAICSHFETEELAPFSRAWNRVGGEQGVVSRFNIIRNRELICFCLKKDFDRAVLGVGVKVQHKGRVGTFESEFDLLSSQAFEEFKIRRSVQGLDFTHWLPLPISRRHYTNIKPDVAFRLTQLSQVARLPTSSTVDVIYAFMNDIVVRLSAQAESGYTRSSLVHASEKAIESYYHLFHLLLCLATANKAIVHAANRMIKAFLVDGKTSKADVPNLGYLLITCLISDADMTTDLLMAIIRETVTRNVVWALDSRGANMPELAYMEADTVSSYRLQKTFDASKTSYRLLMFLNLFRRTINRGMGKDRKSLVHLREELFDAHGAPPNGTAARLASDIKALQRVKNFPEFLKIMGLPPPTASEFTEFLRKSVDESMRKGYSVWGVTQTQALALRLKVDPNVEVRPEADVKAEWRRRVDGSSGFFPNSGGKRGGGGGRGGGRGGVAGNRGRGR